MKTVVTDCRREFARRYEEQQFVGGTKAFEYAQNLELGMELTGDTIDFHNYATELARADYYEAACEVLRQAVLVYPKDTDLLADYIMYAHKCGKHDTALEKFRLLRDIDRVDWTWRSFVFSVDYHIALMGGQLGDERKKTEATIQQLLNEFKTNLPKEEKAYLAESDYYEAIGNRSKAITVLKSVIDGGVVRLCPQCCLRFVDRSLENGDYDTVSVYAKKGIAMTEEQESVEATAFWYFWALAEDHKWQNENLSADEPDKASARKVIRLYHTVTQLNPNPRYEANCEKRMKMIAAFAGVEIPKSQEAPVSESERTVDMAQMLKKLQLMQGAQN